MAQSPDAAALLASFIGTVSSFLTFTELTEATETITGLPPFSCVVLAYGFAALSAISTGMRQISKDINV